MTANAALEGPGSGSFSIPNLVHLAREGSMRVPSVQRSFVWDAGDRIVLNVLIGNGDAHLKNWAA